VTWPKPQPGLVIRYSYLWSREAATGREEGVKDRPCAIVLTVKHEGGDRVYVLPITHSPPTDPEDAVELPPAVKARMGLDEARSWIIVTEANHFLWPGPDLRFAPGAGPESVAMGLLPPALFRLVRDRFVDQVRRRRAKVSGRTE
jgi:hypothetical protein